MLEKEITNKTPETEDNQMKTGKEDQQKSVGSVRGKGVLAVVVS